jgi:hypothetical protein
VIPNGINAEALRGFLRDDAKRDLGLANRFVIGFVGFMREWHGLDRVLDFISADANAAAAARAFCRRRPARPALEAQAGSSGSSTASRSPA